MARLRVRTPRTGPMPTWRTVNITAAARWGRVPEHLESASPKGHGRHRLMMIACCMPMLAIAVVLVATGVAGISFLIVAVMCTAMLALMMGGAMDNGGDRRS